MSQKKHTTSAPSQEGVDLLDLGAARARILFFNAVDALWDRRFHEGVKKSDIAAALGKHPSWVSRVLSGPSNLTIETFAGLAEAMNAQIEVTLTPREDLRPIDNFDFYTAMIDDHRHDYCPLTKVQQLRMENQTSTLFLTGDATNASSQQKMSFAQVKEQL